MFARVRERERERERENNNNNNNNKGSTLTNMVSQKKKKHLPTWIKQCANAYYEYLTLLLQRNQLIPLRVSFWPA